MSTLSPAEVLRNRMLVARRLLTLALAAAGSATAVIFAGGGSRAEAASVRYVRVPGATEGLAVLGNGALTLRRTDQPFVVRVDLLTGKRSVAFQTDGFPDTVFDVGGGKATLAVDHPFNSETGEQRSQVVAFDAATGKGTIVAEGSSRNGCGTSVSTGGSLDTGEVLVRTTTVPCAAPKSGRTALNAIGPAGSRQLLDAPAPDIDGGSIPTVHSVGAWRLSSLFDVATLTNTTTGQATTTVRPTLRHAHLSDITIASDGRLAVNEFVLRRRGGYVQRTRVVRPGDPARGGQALTTLGTPPRANVAFCGDRLVQLRTKDRRTRVIVDGHTVARLKTSADPLHSCDANHLVVAAAGAKTRLAVVNLP